ncbi:hypothetical protein L210DRAFT_871734, partial [Boletus edulis BED1]
PPVGVNFTRPAGQSVYLNAPVTTARQFLWAVEQEGDNTYRLSVGGYRYTGVVDNRVTASIFPEQNVEWIATYRRLQDAYTISPVNDVILGWTIAYDDPNSKVLMSQITLRQIRSGRSNPPTFVPPQLFRFEEVDD